MRSGGIAARNAAAGGVGNGSGRANHRSASTQKNNKVTATAAAEPNGEGTATMKKSKKIVPCSPALPAVRPRGAPVSARSKSGAFNPNGTTTQGTKLRLNRTLGGNNTGSINTSMNATVMNASALSGHSVASAPPGLPSSRRGLSSPRGRDRSAHGSPPVSGRLGASVADRPNSARSTSSQKDAPGGVTYVVGEAVVNPYVSVSPSVQPGLRERAAAAPVQIHAGVMLSSTSALGVAESDRIALNYSSSRSLPLGRASTVRRSIAAGGDLFGGRDSMIFGDSLAFFGDAGEMRSLSIGAAVPQAPEGVAGLVQVDNIIKAQPTVTAGRLGDAQSGSVHCTADLRAIYGTTRDDVHAERNALDMDGLCTADDLFVRASNGSLVTYSQAHQRTSSSSSQPQQHQQQRSYSHSRARSPSPGPAVASGTAADVLPQLLHASERAMELVAVRKHIDWDVTIPTADTLPPPAIAFLDDDGRPVKGVTEIPFVLDTNTLILQRQTDGSGGSDGKKLSGSMSGIAAAAAQLSIGTNVTGEGPRHRVRGLVGLLEGLAERVGLERVMEYRVEAAAMDMFLSAPYVEPATGDLVVELNPSVQGTVRLGIVGFDCGSIDSGTGNVQRSCNTLYCAVRVLQPTTTASATVTSSDALLNGNSKGGAERFNKTQTLRGMVSSARDVTAANDNNNNNNGGGGGGGVRPGSAVGLSDASRKGGGQPGIAREGENETRFSFPATNPHELRYPNCLQAMRDTFIAKLVEQRRAVEQARKEEEEEEQQQQRIENELYKGGSGGDAGNSNDIHDGFRDLNGPNRQDRQHREQRASHINYEIEHASVDASMAAAERELRESTSSLGSLAVGTMQLPLSHLRLTAWQDKVTELLVEQPDLVDDAEAREKCKLDAQQEIGAALLATILATPPPGATASRRRSSAVTGASPSGNFSQRQSGAGQVNTITSEKKLASLHRLILCLLLEENRNSPQLFEDIVCLCHAYYTGALLKTITATGGTKEGLRLAAATMLAQSPDSQPFALPQSSAAVGSGARSHTSKEHKALELLERALRLSMSAMVEIGAYAEGQEYAMQRVHVLILLYRDTTSDVCEAQRDLAEVCFFYGDYPNSLKVAADVLMLAEEVYPVASPEVFDAELLYILAYLACGKPNERGSALLSRMYKIVSGDDDVIDTASLPPLVHAQMLLVLAYARPARESHDADEFGLTSEEVIRFINDAIGLLRTGEEEPSAGLGGSIAAADPNVRRLSVSSNGTSGSTPRRLRWNLLCFAGALLMRYGEIREGLQIQSGIVQEIVLGRHGMQESSNRAALAAVLWVGLVEWQMWAHPTEYDELLPLLRRMVQRVTELYGPMHPLAACANLVLAKALERLPNSQALVLASRSLLALERSVGSRSRYLSLVHDLCARVYTSAHRWKAALRHANASLVLAQLNNFVDEVMCETEQTFIGCLMRVPADLVVQLDTTQLLIALQERIARMEKGYGSQSTALLRPLLNLADFYYLLRDYDSTLSCLDRAMRIADPRSVLFVTRDVLRPAAALASPVEVLERDRMVRGVLQQRDAAISIAQVLFAIAAVREAQGALEPARDAYGRCLALLESVGLEGSLCAVRLYAAMAKVLHATGSLGDAYGWARLAESAVHARYSHWAAEVQSTRQMISVLETNICEKEGTYVVVNPNCPFGGFTDLV